MSTPAPAETKIRELLDAAERADLQGQPQEAASFLSQALALSPDSAAVLGAHGVHFLRARDPAQARHWLERSVAADPTNAAMYLNFATSLRELSDTEAESKALERALTLQPHFTVALIQKGSLLERLGKGKEAARTYHRALLSVRPDTVLPKSWQPVMEHARRTVMADLSALDAWLKERMEEARARHAAQPQDRVDDCLGALVGRNRIYVQQPTYSHFPRLPAIQFYEREEFPWTSAVEEATDGIREELEGLLADSRESFSPYLSHSPDEPLNQWRELNQSRRWSALFLYKDGERQEANAARCPKTLAALGQAPIVRIAHRGPTHFFSLLEPKTHIPAHTGTTNTRLTVHLPLIVPPSCRFRVGTQTREWHPGKLLIFDDTIEHEAWNDSDQERVILIFDIWNPLLTAAERDLMAVATAAIAEFYAD
ncbi:MAG: aspartyl/asparaginyl beta-hydroxylase domain-containing protein [Steroidobacteraceae bacterium]